MELYLGFLSGGPGWLEILLVALVALLLFGKRLPDLARSLGKGITEFKKGLKDVEEEVSKSVSEDPPPGNDSTPEG